MVMKMVKGICCCQWIFLYHLLLAAFVCSKTHGNPANELLDIINNNRTAQNLRQLNNSPGLGCIALQYAELCKDNCSANGAVNCKPPEDDFTEVFAPNCGVELPTFGTISGLVVGCQPKYLKPPQAFTRVLVKDNKSLALIRNKSHTEVGAGLVGFPKGPFLWCVLFSNDKINKTFVLEDRGIGVQQKKGCYSGSNFPCSKGQKIEFPMNNVLNFVLIEIVCLFLYLL